MATTERGTSPLRESTAGQSVLKRIGNTPLLRLERIARKFPNIEFCGKAEWFNPGGSVKDRAALCIPDSASPERKRILAAFGAKMIITPGDEGTDGAVRRVRKIVAGEPEKYFYPDQYSNAANWQAHYRGTANEIWEQTAGRITHFVTGLGTSGTFVGTTRRLKELNPAIRCISLQPDAAFHGLEGWKHMPTAIRPAIYDSTLADENLEVDTEGAYHLVKRIAREEGLLVSPSAAAALLGCFAIAACLPKKRNAVIVTVFPDSGAKYLNERFWEEE